MQAAFFAYREKERDGRVRQLMLSGELQEFYKHKATALGLSDRVAFPGFVPDERLPDYYRLADVTVLPSINSGEAFGLVLLESLACATPVIASSLPGVRTVVADGLNLRRPLNSKDPQLTPVGLFLIHRF